MANPVGWFSSTVSVASSMTGASFTSMRLMVTVFTAVSDAVPYCFGMSRGPSSVTVTSSEYVDLVSKSSSADVTLMTPDCELMVKMPSPSPPVTLYVSVWAISTSEPVTAPPVMTVATALFSSTVRVAAASTGCSFTSSSCTDSVATADSGACGCWRDGSTPSSVTVTSSSYALTITLASSSSAAGSCPDGVRSNSRSSAAATSPMSARSPASIAKHGSAARSPSSPPRRASSASPSTRVRADQSTARTAGGHDACATGWKPCSITLCL